MFLYHYFDKNVGSFRNISDLPVDAATELLDTIRKEKPNTLCAKRQSSYIQDRLHYEKILREEFIKKVVMLSGKHRIIWLLSKVPG